MVDHEETIAYLEREFLPLDSALVRSLLSDFDLDDGSQLATAKEILESLRASATVEENSGFDASGTSAETNSRDGSKSRQEQSDGSESITGLSADTSALSLDSSSSASAFGCSAVSDESSVLSDDAKLSMLVELFPTLKTHDIAFVLRRNGHDVNKAMDICLNQAFLEESSTSEGESVYTRGIDAFSDVNGMRRGRQKKSRAKKFQHLNEYARSSSEPASIPANKWSEASEDIKFISSRVNMSAAAVSSIYHKNGASRKKTITAMVESDIRTTKAREDAQLESNAVDLLDDFPVLTFEQCTALLRLTAPSTAKAHELAKVLATTENPRDQGPRMLIPQYVPVKLTDESAPRRAPVPQAAGDSRTVLAARSAAFENASRYHRLGKSDRMMGGAAAYYSQQGRDASAALKGIQAAEADALAASQAASGQLDLHGVTVKEATRIACEYTQAWWDGLGESRIPGGGRGGVGTGYRIVTGAGRHSVGGVGKLTPAVMRALIAGGWKVEVGTGVLVVTGKAKR